jgi:hypothetical protein
MAMLNITMAGVSADYQLEIDHAVTDRDVKRIAVEIVRSGEVRSLHRPDLGDDAFEHYVVDRFENKDGGQRIYLRPKVPFGAA